ncbi:MAG: DUF2723 domain-containing protein [Chloroflexi bacterium]|nr:DUF2723 domain-containing protein [Chloroflexota bacterium]
MKNKKKYTGWFLQGLLGISLSLVYLNSMAPGLTWANNGSDGGDLIAAAATNGIAHPTGYPIYLLLARLFQFLPIGNLAYRTNLMSAVAAVFASSIVYRVATRHLGDRNELAGSISAFAFGLSPVLWSQAVITEVYALHALFTAAILYLSHDSEFPAEQVSQDRILGLTFGLALGNHVTSLLMFPLLLPGNKPARLRSILRRLAWIGAGLLSYFSLPIRAASQPPVNWGNPAALDGFWWLVSGSQYQFQLFDLDPFSAWIRIRTIAGLLIEQFGIPGLTVGLIGIIVFYKRNRLNQSMVWMVAAHSMLAIAYATADSFLYLIPTFLCFSIGIGSGVNGLMESLDERLPKTGLAIGFTSLLYLFVLAGIHWPQVDASHDRRAEDFGKQILAEAPANSIVFTKGDKATFALWYFHYALRQRPDLAVIATDLLYLDWYQQTLRATYPDLELPGPFPFASSLTAVNPKRPACYVEYTGLKNIRCFPPPSP